MLLIHLDILKVVSMIVTWVILLHLVHTEILQFLAIIRVCFNFA